MLQDIIAQGLQIVFTLAYSEKSQRHNLYYVYERNIFYKMLAKTGFTERELKPTEEVLLPRLGIGLVNIRRDFPEDPRIRQVQATIFKEKILKYKPLVVAFNGKEGARIYFGKASTKEIKPGLQEETIGKTKLYVASSTAFRAQQYFEEDNWQQLKELVNTLQLHK